jgi:hypothetical protein
LPVVELDKHFWQPGLVPVPRARWIEIQRRLADQERWIVDGDLGKYDELGVRLQAADTVLILDFGVLLCLMRAMRRSKERIDFWRWLLTWRWIERPKIKRAIAEYAARAEVRILSSPEELERFYLLKRQLFQPSQLTRDRPRGRGTECPDNGHIIVVRDGIEAQRPETRNPCSFGSQGARLAIAGSGAAGRAL